MSTTFLPGITLSRRMRGSKKKQHYTPLVHAYKNDIVQRRNETIVWFHSMYTSLIPRVRTSDIIRVSMMLYTHFTPEHIHTLRRKNRHTKSNLETARLDREILPQFYIIVHRRQVVHSITINFLSNFPRIFFGPRT